MADLASQHLLEGNDTIDVDSFGSNSPQNYIISATPIGTEHHSERYSCLACRILRKVTVEPVMFMCMMGWSLEGDIFEKVLIDKVCEREVNDSNICEHLHNHTEEQDLVQRQVSLITMYMEIIKYFPSIVFVMFLGSWSDTHGRKLPIIIPIIGFFFAALWKLINVHFWFLPPELMILNAVPHALTGGPMMLYVAVFSYIADITKEGSRSTRISIVDCAFFTGRPIGLYIGRTILEHLGYTMVYSVSSINYSTCAAYVIVCIKNNRASQIVPDELERSGHCCRDVFRLGRIRDTFATCLKTRENSARTKILLLMSAYFVGVFRSYGDSLEFLYTRKKFGWSYSQFVTLSIAASVARFFGTMIILPLLSYKLNVRDSILAIVAGINEISADILRALGSEPWLIFLSDTVGNLSPFLAIICRSLISKHVNKTEVGQVFAVMGAISCLIPLFSPVAFNLTYNATLDFLPGGIFLMQAAGTLYITSVHVLILCMDGKRRKHAQRSETIT